MGDSFYEYLLKMWLYTGKKVPQYTRMVRVRVSEPEP